MLNFANWPSLREISVDTGAVPQQWLHEMQCDPDWFWRWYQLTRDNYIGNPKPYGELRWTSPILVEHTYNLFKYEKKTKHSLMDCDIIFEIGGGYGLFCRLIMNAGFNGVYLIYDLPHLHAIQRLFLTWNGFNEASFIKDDKEKLFSLITAQAAEDALRYLQMLKAAERKMKIGVVATWSLSEMPLEKGKDIMHPLSLMTDRFLLAYQSKYESIDNISYFDNLKSKREDLVWYNWQEPHQSYYPHQSFYLMA